MSGFQFQPRLVGQIRAGRKTQTRRIIKGDQACTRIVGKSYAVQPGRGKPSDGLRIRVTDIRHELLGEISYADARAEGFRTTDEFKAYWVRLHEGKLGEAEDAELLQRFNERHADSPVWVISFEVDREERVRLLADRNVAGDYVEHPARALAQEPEAVSEEELRRLVKQAEERARGHRSTRAKDLDLLDAEDRMREAHAAAQRLKIDTGGEFSHLKGTLKRYGPKHDKTIAHLEGLERKVGLRPAA